jgi:hypothetical protein
MRQQFTRVVARFDPDGLRIRLVDESVHRHGGMIDRLVVAIA